MCQCNLKNDLTFLFKTTACFNLIGHHQVVQQLENLLLNFLSTILKYGSNFHWVYDTLQFEVFMMCGIGTSKT
jgi:hypothetical protein